ncbi:MAG: carbohydrate kinase [Geminicoccaceae bacterium]|nr:carbohydrate kinase [Geminicoccaceae bacterium]
MALTVGIDVGTTSTIGILIDTDGRTLALASRPTDLHSEHPGWAEEDPEQWWRNACAVTRELLQRAGRQGRDVAAVGVTGMLPAVVLLDRSDRLLRRSIQQSDGRTGREVGELRAEFDPALFVGRTGNGINQQLVAAKLRWLERHEPEAFARIATVFGSYDYVNWRLTGIKTLERNWALESGFLDLATGALAPDLVALGHIELSVLPPVRQSHEVIGAVTPEAAAATGLAAGTPVVAGCADHVASAFVAGIRSHGDLLLKFGGAGDILLATATPKPDPRLFLDYHIVPGLFMPNGCMACSGAVLNWIVRELASGEALEAEARRETPHAALDRRAAAVPPGAEGLVLLPYFLGEKTPLHDPRARGTLVGLGLHHTLAHIWRAALEGIAFGFRHHVELFEELGLSVRHVVASDGGARSRVWMQIAADVLGRPVHLLQGHPGSCLGAAYVAGFGIGALDDWDGIGRFVAAAGAVEPDPANAGLYRERYALFHETYRRLQPLYPRLAGAGDTGS